MSTTRRFPRVQLALDVHVRFENLADAMAARTLNLSKEGLFIEMDRPAAVGTRVRVSLEVADTGEKFAVEGVVVRRQPDEEDPATTGQPPGVAVFLTLTPPGWTRWCDQLLAAAR